MATRITLDTLVCADPPTTAERSILAAIRQGVYPWVAAEATGISREQFAAWLKSRERRYRRFAQEVRKARAWARLVAERHLFSDEPRVWLKSGPGREQNGEPGWSKDVPPLLGKESRLPHPLTDAAWRDLLGKVLETLTPFPEARAALIATLQLSGGASTPGGSGR